MEDNNNRAINETQPGTTQPEDSGTQTAGKTFTQEELNKIVSDRLARERSKSATSDADTRESGISKRENALTCREYISEAGYPRELLEVFPTDDAERFKECVNKIAPLLKSNTPAITTGVNTNNNPPPHDPLADAFKPR